MSLPAPLIVSLENGEKQPQETILPAQPVSPTPILAGSENDFFAFMRKQFDTGEVQELKEGRRIQFYEGKRKLKDGTTKKTGHHYWEWVYRDPDTGARKRPYGGTIRTTPSLYQYRVGKYEALVASRKPEPLANNLFRLSGITVSNGDTG